MMLYDVCICFDPDTSHEDFIITRVTAWQIQQIDSLIHQTLPHQTAHPSSFPSDYIIIYLESNDYMRYNYIASLDVEDLLYKSCVRGPGFFYTIVC